MPDQFFGHEVAVIMHRPVGIDADKSLVALSP
jgi:hypothetical protein